MHSNVDLIRGNMKKSLFLFALPLFISNVFQQLYNTADTMIVGNFLGDTSLAAIGACSVVYNLLVGFALGIGNGLSIVTARSYGSGDKELLKRSAATSLVIGIIITAVMMLLSHFILLPLLYILNTPVDIIDEAYSYISILTLFMGIMLAYNLCAGLLKAIGNSIMPLVFLILSAILNIFLDILFITVFDSDIRGAAIATVISQGISVILCVFYIYKKCPILIPSKKHFAFDKELYKELLGQGLSMGFMTGIVSMGTVVLQSAINNMGYLLIAGHTVARKLHNFCLMPITTLALALSTFVSQNRGADQGIRIRQAVRYANLLVVSWGIIVSSVLFFCAPILVKLLSGSNETAVIQNGANYLKINAPFYTVLGILLNLRYSLQGLGQKVIPLVSSIIELFGKILFTLLIIPLIGYLGVILCEPVIWCFMCIQLIFSFYQNPYIRAHKAKQTI